MLEVSKNRTMPGVRRNRQKYPFSSMTDGDSFFVPSEDLRRTQRAVHSAAYARGYRIATRGVQEYGRVGIRVWYLGRRAEQARDVATAV